MFIFQIPISQDPNNVMPRIVPPAGGGPGPDLPTIAPRGPTTDPWIPANKIMTQQQASLARARIRRNTVLGRTMTNLLGADLTYNEDGSYSRPNDTGKYYYQADGSVFYSGGTITLPSGQVTARNPQTLRNPANPGSKWDESAAGKTALLGTFALNRLDLVPDGGGAFILPGEGNIGRYLLQSDGSVFYEGGTRGGRNAPAQTYVNGNWDTTKNIRLPGSMPVGIPLADGRWIVPSDDSNPEPYLITTTESRKTIRFRPGATDMKVFEYRNNSWIQLTNRYGYYHDDKQVSGALQTYRRAPYVTSPQPYTTDSPDFDTRISTAKTNLTNNGATNIEVSNRFLFNQSTLLLGTELKDVIQIISYTQGGTQKYKVITSTMNGNTVSNSREYEFTRKDLQRIANNHSIQISNWDNPNELINLIGAHFSMDRHPRAGTFRAEELQKELAETNSSIQDRTQRRSPQLLDCLCDKLAYDTIELECWNMFNNNETVRNRFNSDANAFWWTVYQPNCGRLGSFGRLIPREFNKEIWARVPQLTEANLNALRAEILRTATTATIRTTSPY